VSFVGGTNRGRIVVTRPIVPADDRDLGYLPGDLEQKMLPFTMPMYDVFESTYSRTAIERFLAVEPLGFMRGRTFTNTWLIADEMQNATKEQMKMLLTRVGHGTKLIITGDLGPDNGLSDLLYRLEGFDLTHIKVVRMDTGDILRHPSVQEVIKIYEV
jgi:phosphate starvation-inducible protein PhoH and related proteins